MKYYLLQLHGSQFWANKSSSGKRSCTSIIALEDLNGSSANCAKHVLRELPVGWLDAWLLIEVKDLEVVTLAISCWTAELLYLSQDVSVTSAKFEVTSWTTYLGTICTETSGLEDKRVNCSREDQNQWCLWRALNRRWTSAVLTSEFGYRLRLIIELRPRVQTLSEVKPVSTFEEWLIKTLQLLFRTLISLDISNRPAWSAYCTGRGRWGTSIR